MFVLSAALGIISAASGITASALLDLPSGVCVVISSSLVFGIALAFSPKRRQLGHG